MCSVRSVVSWTVYFLIGIRTVFALDYSVIGAANVAPYKSQISIVNRSTGSAQVTLAFIGTGGSSEPIQKSIAPLQTLVLQNAIEELWGLSGQSGVVTISSDRLLLVSASKYRETDARGRIGTSLPVVAGDDLLAHAAYGDLLWVAQDANRLSSSVLVYLARAGTEAELVVFNGEGIQVGARTIAGGPQFFEIPISSLVATELKVGRAELRIKSGRGTATLELLDSATGDLTSSAASPNVVEDILGVPIAFHTTKLGSVTLRTDMRFYNPNSTAARITARLGAVLRTLDIAPQKMVEFNGLLASVFGAQEGTQGLVTFASTIPLVAQVRNVATNTASGSAVDYGETHAVPRAEPTLHQGWSTAIGGLRGASAQLLLHTRTVGTTGSMDLKIRNSVGDTLGSGTINLGLREQRLDAMSDVFPGVTIPDDAFLEINSITGSVGAVVLSLDKASNDIEYLAAEGLPPSDGPCAAPAFSFINVSERNLSAPGDVTFEWGVRSADAVELTPGSALTSSPITIPVSSNTQFRLSARNSCGETSVPITVSVGRPALKSVEYAAAESSPTAGGQPGQVFRLATDNLGDTSALSKLILRDSGGQLEMELPVAGFDQDGVPYARVPLLPYSSTPEGYRTGTFALTAVVAGAETAPIPFTILPLTSISDPVAAFRTMLDQIAAASQAAIASNPDGPSAALEAARTGAAKIEAELRKMVSDIETNGRATLAYGSWNAASPSPVTVTVTAADLAVLMAYNARYLKESPTPGGLQPRATFPLPRAAGTCIKDKDWYIPFCQALENAIDALFPLTAETPNIFNVPEMDEAFARGRDALASYITDKLKNSAINGIVMKANLMLNWNNLLCTLQPIRLDDFDVAPAKYQVNKYLGSTELHAILVPKHKNAQDVVNSLIKLQTDKVLGQLPKKYEGLKSVLEPLVSGTVRLLYGEFESQIVEFIRQHLPGVKSSQRLQVGKCDIEKFYPLSFGSDESKAPTKRDVLIPIFSNAVEWGRDNYSFQGNAVGPDTMCVRPDPKKFLFSSRRLANLQAHPDLRKQSCQFKAVTPIGVGSTDPAISFSPRAEPASPPPAAPEFPYPISVGGRAEFFVDGYDLNAWCIGCIDASGQTGIIGPGIQGQRQEIQDGPSLSDIFIFQNSRATIYVARSGETVKVRMSSKMELIPQPDGRVHIHDSLAKSSLRFTIPPSRYGTQTISVDFALKPGCQRPATYAVAVFGEEGGAPNFTGRPPFKRQFTRATRGIANLTVGGELTGFAQVNGTCELEATFEFLDNPIRESVQ